MDIRDYKGVIREAVRQVRHKDQNWSWKVRAINKDAAKIGWGYLDYLGSKDDFIVKVDENGDFVGVVGIVPDGKKIIRLIGEGFFNDYKTVEEGIDAVIHAMANYARSVY